MKGVLVTETSSPCFLRFLDYFNIGEPSTTNKTGAYNMETVWVTGNIVVSVEPAPPAYHKTARWKAGGT